MPDSPINTRDQAPNRTARGGVRLRACVIGATIAAITIVASGVWSIHTVRQVHEAGAERDSMRALVDVQRSTELHRLADQKAAAESARWSQAIELADVLRDEQRVVRLMAQAELDGSEPDAEHEGRSGRATARELLETGDAALRSIGAAASGVMHDESNGGMSRRERRLVLARLSACLSDASGSVVTGEERAVHRAIGAALLEHGRADLAVRHLRHADRSLGDPDDARAQVEGRRTLASALLALGRSGESHDVAWRAWRSLPPTAPRHLRDGLLALRAEALRDSGRGDEATELLRQRLALWDGTAVNRTAVSRAASDLAAELERSRELDEAEALVRAALVAVEGDPIDAEPHEREAQFRLVIRLVSLLQRRGVDATADQEAASRWRWIVERLEANDIEERTLRDEAILELLLPLTTRTRSPTDPQHAVDRLLEPVLIAAWTDALEAVAPPSVTARLARRMVALLERSGRGDEAELWRLDAGEEDAP